MTSYQEALGAIYHFLSEWPSTAVVLFLSIFLLPGPCSYYSARLLRYTSMAIIYSIISVELLLYFIVRLFIKFCEAFFYSANHGNIRSLMKKAKSYAEWHKLAAELDKDISRESGKGEWKEDLYDYTADFFNWNLIKDHIADMQFARENFNIKMALDVLQDCTRKNTCGIFSEELYSYTYTGEPKSIVNEFLEEVDTTIKWVTDLSDVIEDKKTQSADASHQNPSHSVFNYLTRAKLIVGRRALCLSGGGVMGCYHFGIVRALFDEKLLPGIISGSSAGSMVGAFVCTRTDEELERDLRPEIIQPRFTCCGRSWPERILSFFKNGSFFDNEEWLELCDWFTCGSMTFQEAYLKTGRVLCITISAKTTRSPPVVLNHITTPNVIIASAVVASSSLPNILTPFCLRRKNAKGEIEILKEEFWDGSIDQDIPMSGLSELMNCNFFVVAQANPHIVPFVFEEDGGVGNPNRWKKSRRGGHLFSGLEKFLKMDVVCKLSFLKAVGAVTGFTANLASQTFFGNTTIVPDVVPIDYLKVIENPTMKDMERYFQGGKVAAYRHVALMRLHREFQQRIETCLKSLKMQHEEKDELSPQEEGAPKKRLYGRNSIVRRLR